MMWTLRSPLGRRRAGHRSWIVVTIVASAILATSNTIRPAENLTVSSSGDADGVFKACIDGSGRLGAVFLAKSASSLC